MQFTPLQLTPNISPRQKSRLYFCKNSHKISLLKSIYSQSVSGKNSMISPISTSRVLQILCRTVSVTSSSRRRRVIVLGAIPAALRRSALLIFLSTRSFQSLLYEIAISFDLRLQISTLLYALFDCKAREFRNRMRNSLFANSCEGPRLLISSHLILFAEYSQRNKSSLIGTIHSNYRNNIKWTFIIISSSISISKSTV